MILVVKAYDTEFDVEVDNVRQEMVLYNELEVDVKAAFLEFLDSVGYSEEDEDGN